MSSAAHKQHKGPRPHSGGGGGRPEDRDSRPKTPYLNEASALAMDAFIEASHKYALVEHSIVGPWFRGRIPTVMLEHPPAVNKRKIVALLARWTDDENGPDLNLTEYRAKIILTTIQELEAEANKDLPLPIQISENTALKSLFPANAVKSRETERSNLMTSTQNLMGKMLFAWTSKEIQTSMMNKKSLMDAHDNVDLLQFLEELRKFCLEGSGNPEANREKAEKHLTDLTMKRNQSLDYFKEFTAAVHHIKVCKSTFQETKIVDLFIRHLDQTQYPNWYVQFLTEDHPMFKLKTGTFEQAKQYALKYYDEVIRTTTDLKISPKERDRPPGKPTTITTVRDLKNALVGSDGSEGMSMVNHTVLATILKGKRDRLPKEDASKKKIKAEISKDEKPKEKPVCFKFRDNGSCKYGSKCMYSHTV